MNVHQDLGHIKGVAFREFAVWYAKRISADHINTVVGNLEATYPGVFDRTRSSFGILATRWYDARLVHVFLDRLVSRAGGADLDKLAQDAATEIMGNTLSGVYKFLFSTFASPSLYARHANKLWSLHYDTGAVTIEARGDREALGRYDNWRSHHPLICRLNMSATLPIYQAMGCANVSWSKLACVDDGAAACEMLVRWDG